MLKLSDRKWQEFRISDILDVTGTVTTHPSKLVSGGCVPRITCSASDNGLDGFYKNEATEKGGVLTVDSATVGYVSYQENDFIATDHVEKLSSKNGKAISRYLGLFLKQSIDSAVSGKYNYGYKFSQTRIKTQIFMLPVNSAGQPDYDFMEQYVQERIKIKRQDYINYLKHKIAEIGSTTGLAENRGGGEGSL